MRKVLVFHKFEHDASLDRMILDDVNYFKTTTGIKILITESRLKRFGLQVLGLPVLNNSSRAYGFIPTKIQKYLRGYLINPSLETNRFYYWNIALTSLYAKREFKQILANAEVTFRNEIMKGVKKENSMSVTIFGTGPSLSKLQEINIPSGIRIVCNTIVRDSETIKFLKPDILVAADALYHFGNNSHSKIFMSDVIKRFGDATFFFMYPAVFDFLIRKKVPASYHHRLIPIASSRSDRNERLDISFSLPN